VEREPDVDLLEEPPAALAAPVDSRELGAIFLGGMIGALARAGLEEALAVAPGGWPWATFAVNLLAALLLGFAVSWLRAKRHGLYARAFLATGICGALSTFSTVMLELVRLQEHAGWGLACAYGMASIAAGMAAVLLGIELGRRRAAAASRRRPPVAPGAAG
jgi:CrcB protein